MYYITIKEQLESIVKEQKEVLDLEINPHLILEHNEIFKKHVQEWFFLYEDLRNWKWWWWANNPWWN